MAYTKILDKTYPAYDLYSGAQVEVTGEYTVSDIPFIEDWVASSLANDIEGHIASQNGVPLKLLCYFDSESGRLRYIAYMTENSIYNASLVDGYQPALTPTVIALLTQLALAVIPLIVAGVIAWFILNTVQETYRMIAGPEDGIPWFLIAIALGAGGYFLAQLYKFSG